MIRNLLILTLCIAASLAVSAKPMNVLFIAIDDINDWIGPLEGHPQAKTPNMDRFCNGGAMIFRNAVCPAPVCGPSRSAVLSGFMPNRTGVYGNGTNMIDAELVKAHATLPEYFSKHGYHSLSNGKVFHKHATTNGWVDFGHWAFDEHARARRYVNDKPDMKKVTGCKAGVINGEKRPEYQGKGKLSWGPTVKPFEETVDYRVADWGRKKLFEKRDKPFFMALGIIKPHLPWFVPQEFFDLYDLDSVQAPEVRDDDLADILAPSGKPLFKPSADYEWIKKHGLEKEATRAYLANISYADACLGIILGALEDSGQADNTIVVIWGDHGWHLGEKQRFLKSTLWAEVTKVPFIVRLPTMSGPAYCDRTVSLIDLYPTLLSLCGLPEKELDGHDFSGLLNDPETDWDHPGVTVSSSGTSVMDQRWHYISHLSGAEEFYDTEKDPMEWSNLIASPEHASKIAELRKSVPKERIILKTGAHPKPKNYVDADADPTIKPGRDLSRLK